MLLADAAKAALTFPETWFALRMLRFSAQLDIMRLAKRDTRPDRASHPI
jgi:hypothetical protein